MNKIDIDDNTLDYWATKYVTKPDDEGYVLKFFKKDGIHEPYSFEMQRNILKKKREYIWKFIPETELIKNDDGSYYIKQQYIEWKLLKFSDINQLDEHILSDVLELFDWYAAYCKDEWVEMDVTWYQPDFDSLCNIRERRFFYYTRIFNGFLTSTNIIISNDNKVYMVDVCDVLPIHNGNQKLYKIKSTIRQILAGFGVKIAKYKIHRIIKQKREELLDALS